MSKNIVSQPPLMVPMVDKSGNLNRAWSIWFRDVYNRTAYKGGNAIDDNLSSIEAINLNIEGLQAQITINVQGISTNAAAIVVNAAAISDNAANIVINATAISDNADAISIFQPDTRNVTADTTAVQYEFLSVTCSTVDITVTLPDATLTPGASIWVHKVDATAFKVLTSVKDIFFQGTTMHLISNGVDWIPS